MGSGLTDELAEMAETMERQQVLVHLGEQVGIPVRVIANPSADSAGDLVALAEALQPQYYLVASPPRTSTAAGRYAVVECPVELVAAGTCPRSSAAPRRRHWTPDADGDAAVVQAARLAAHRARRALGSGGRRFDSLRRRPHRARCLGEAVDATSAGHHGHLAPGSGRVRVRSEVDATPVDWSTVDLGGRSAGG